MKDLKIYHNPRCSKSRQTLQIIKDSQKSASFLHIDMNNPIPEVAALEFFYKCMGSGSIIIFDDYGFPGFESQNAAINRWCDESHIPRPISIPTGQGLIIK